MAYSVAVRSLLKLRWLWLSLLCVGALSVLARDAQHDLAQPQNLHQVSYVGSKECLRCHSEHSASWYQTFHRTMTQPANEQSVAGDFSGATLRYFGATAHMERDEKGGFVVRYAGPGFPEQRFEVDTTVGSRRYQQYLGKRGSAHLRLPVAYDIAASRWFHMNGAFLTQDPASDSALLQGDFERHLTRWNDNCIFCHNVAPNPGQHGDGFASEVAEFGIACEACHGPGEKHVRKNHNPVRRFSLHLGDGRDPSIVNPRRLSHERAADVCGRCHGQRITDDVGKMLRSGDPFIPGEDLALYSAPLWHDTPMNGQPGLFTSRFWPDGTPRLTAYEYQGLLLSPCYQRGELTCTSCHGMHEGAPEGQLRPGKSGAGLCTDCHAELAEGAAQVAHARHGDTPPSCTSCHMPPIVYGVIASHVSHRIETLSPAQAEKLGRPDACTLCHAEKTRGWAVRAYAELFGADEPARPPRQEALQSDLSEMETQLFAGDPIERALAAKALGDLLRPARAARLKSLLLEVLQHDPYPVVRRLAARALQRLWPEAQGELFAFVPESEPQARTKFVERLMRDHAFEPEPLDAQLLDTLRARAKSLAIDIGE